MSKQNVYTYTQTKRHSNIYDGKVSFFSCTELQFGPWTITIENKGTIPIEKK